MPASPAAPTSILIPEIPFDLEKVAERLRERDALGREVQHRGRRRGRASRTAGTLSLLEAAHGGHVERLGGVGAQVCAALRADDRQGNALVSCSGTCSAAARPTAFDRVLATRFGGKAVELI